MIVSRLALALAFLVLAIAVATAAAPEGTDPNSPMAKWFESVQHPRLGKCCSISDGHFVQARKENGGWQALLNGTWTAVPPDAVLSNEASPNGEPVVWLSRADGSIRCFIPAGSGT